MQIRFFLKHPFLKRMAMKLLFLRILLPAQLFLSCLIWKGPLQKLLILKNLLLSWRIVKQIKLLTLQMWKKMFPTQEKAIA